MSLCEKCVADCNCGVQPGELVTFCGAYKAPASMTKAPTLMTTDERIDRLCCLLERLIQVISFPKNHEADLLQELKEIQEGGPA